MLMLLLLICLLNVAYFPDCERLARLCWKHLFGVNHILMLAIVRAIGRALDRVYVGYGRLHRTAKLLFMAARAGVLLLSL